MLPEALEELKNQHTNAVAEMGHYQVGSDEWTTYCEAAERLNKSIKMEEDRIDKEVIESNRIESEEAKRLEDRHKQRMDFANGAFKIGAQAVCLFGVALLAAKVERDPEAGIGKGFRMAVDKAYRVLMG